MTDTYEMEALKPVKCPANTKEKGDGGDVSVTYTIPEETTLKKSHRLSMAWNSTIGKVGEDWVFLVLLGIVMACISLTMDYGIGVCMTSRLFLYRDLATNPYLRYLAWIWLPVFLILFSTGFTKLVAPQAAGSGIPEMKTILRGVVIKEHFSFKALIAKIIGLTATLGTGLPLGKEGPFVHISCMAAILLTKATAAFRGMYENKSRHHELLAAACAVGVATAFATPVGGVLFSIEVTSNHFAVRNYWRGFFAAVCATMVHRLLAVWFHDEETLRALYPASFQMDFPYTPPELIVFAIIGVVCGFMGGLFVWLHRKYVMFKKNNKIMQIISERSIFLYPFLVTLLYSSLTFPLGLGMFVASDISAYKLMTGLFSNFSWTKENPSVQEFNILNDWQTQNTGVILHLFMYVIFTFLGTILASTIPVPAGIFIPVFKVGAAFGRMVGEIVAVLFSGQTIAGRVAPGIIPGGYAIVGAAALAGAVTHTVSSSVIAFEITGTLNYCIPVMMAVLIANGIAQALQPSIFDSIIKMKNFPYLPNIASTQSKAHDICVEDFMVRDVKFIFYGMTYKQLQSALIDNKKLRSLPVVDSKEHMILLGSATRAQLSLLIENLLNDKRKRNFFYSWKLAAERYLDGMEEAVEEKKQTLENIAGQGTFRHGRNTPKFFVSDNDPDPDIVASADTNKSVTNNELKPFNGNSEERRPSRFSVTKVEEAQLIARSVEVDMIPSPGSLSEINNSSFTPGMRPKSILKKTQSFIYDSKMKSPLLRAYSTIHAGDPGGLKLSFGSWRSKTSLKLDSKASSHITFTGLDRADISKHLLLERILKEEKKWEEQELSKIVDFSQCEINPAPHQLVERTNLLKVHSIFSLLGLSHAYVTAIGRLIGVVTLSQLRKVIEGANTGEFRRLSNYNMPDIQALRKLSRHEKLGN